MVTYGAWGILTGLIWILTLIVTVLMHEVESPP